MYFRFFFFSPKTNQADMGSDIKQTRKKKREKIIENYVFKIRKSVRRWFTITAMFYAAVFKYKVPHACSATLLMCTSSLIYQKITKGLLPDHWILSN